MSKAIRPFFLVLGVLFAAALPLRAQGVPEFELGYRFVDISGNEQMYRTQINDRPGFLLRSLSFNSAGPMGGILDYAHLDVSDVGAGPAGMLRFTAGQVETFRLTFSWRRTNLYSALPAFANPFLEDGVVPGQHTYNRTRDIYDATLELFPGKTLTPILGYTRNVYRGPGNTTYHVGENEFALDDEVRSRDEEYRVGLAFDAGPVRGAVIQGWRHYLWTDTATLQPGAGNGNIDFPIFGQNVTADGITRTTDSKINTPVTSAWVTGKFLGRIKVIGSYIRANASGPATDSIEADTGNFVSFELARFFSGLNETITSSAHTDYWRGSARAEINLAANVDLTGGWTERRRSLDGTALVSSLFVDAVTFGGVSVGDLQRVIDSDTSLERMDRTYDATVTARLLGPVSANAGWSQTHQDVTFGADPDLLAAGEGDRFSRVVNTYGGGVTFSQAGFTLGADYRRDHADRPIFRSDFINRDRYKVRAGWSWKDLVRIGGTWQETHANDAIVEIGYNTRVRELAGDLEVGPIAKVLTIHGSAGEFKVDRDILIRQPQDFDIAESVQKELGHTWEGGLRLAWERFTLDGAFLWMGNDGSIPFTINRVRARAEAFVTKNVGIAGEWWRDQYGEKPAFDQAGSLANFNGNRYYVGLHWRP